MTVRYQGTGSRSLGTLVDQQVAAWRLRNKAEDAEAPKVEVAPVITISRQASALGAQIARTVAKELSFALWDEELVTRLADRAQSAEHNVRVVDERQRGLFEDMLANSLPGSPISSSTYRTLLEETIRELGAAGSAVIVGRGANFMLEAAQAFRVRIICPLAERVARHALHAGASEAAAVEAVHKVDRDRLGFVKQLTGKDAADVEQYDLVVNTARLGVAEAAHVISAAYRARHRPTTIVLRRASLPSRNSLPPR